MEPVDVPDDAFSPRELDLLLELLQLWWEASELVTVGLAA